MVRHLLCVIALACSLFQCSDADESSSRGEQIAYWLWAGLTAHDAPPNSDLYVFQGTIHTDSTSSTYERQGLFPHPIKARSLHLVYRLEGSLPPADSMVQVFERAVTRWQRHPVAVDGVQLDFDSPTAKLAEYARFLQDVRSRLDTSYALSITGLGDWVLAGDRGALEAISSQVDELVIQLYQGRQPLADIDSYVIGLSRLTIPFRVGLIAGYELPGALDRLKKNSAFRGLVYFVVRDA